MKPDSVDAVLFDLDDTLVDRAATFANYCRELVDRWFPADASSERRAEASQFLIALDEHGHRDRADLFGRFVKQWGLPCAPDELVRAWMDTFGAAAIAQDGVHALLDSLTGRYKLGVVTNGLTAMQHRKMDALGITDRFEVILISQQVGVRKPDPKIYHMACAALGVEPGRALFVGDHLAWDVQGPRDAGLQAVWFRKGSNKDGEIGRLTDLLAML